MHEAGLCDGVLGVVLDVAGEQRVSRVRVRLGEGQGVLADHFEFHWQVLATGTPAEEAALDLVEVPGDDLVVEWVQLAGGEVLRNPTLDREAGAG